MENKDFTLYPESFELKQLGFDEPCFAYYKDGRITGVNKWDREDWGFHVITNKDITSVTSEIVIAPTYSQAFRFFREKYGLKHDIDDDNVGTKFYYKIRSYTDKFDNYNDIIKPMREERDWSKIEFYSYKEAELECLIKLIELVKKK